MRRMSKVWWALVVSASLGLSAFWSTPAKAGPLTIVTENWATFSGKLGVLVTPLPLPNPFLDYFDFAPKTEDYDGAIISAVYHGTGPWAGQYVYLYQLKFFAGSSSGHLQGFAQKLFSPIPPLGDTVYQIPDPSILFGPAHPNTGLTGAVYTNPSPVTGAISWNFDIYRDDQDSGAHDPPGDQDPPVGGTYEDIVSYLVAFVHPNPPVKVGVNMKDAGTDLRNPLVYTPSPEPSAFALLCLGMVGVAGFRRYYRKRS